jgi:alkanesulfonate monooxygenase SsuD/methylene tetrahydromethanopterin reductase-like flavin-dependent oxidoreductase (luciferase family)
MHLGYFAMPLHPPTRDWGQALQENREAVTLADKLGYSEAWIGEHITTTSEPITSPLLFLATVIPETRHIRLGTAVVNLPHHHPAHLAAQAAMFDQLSGGRLMLGIGPGGMASDAELFHSDPETRGAMMLEAVDMMTAIWTRDPPYDLKGKFWDCSVTDFVIPEYGVGFIGKPFQKPHPPIALALRSPQSSGTVLCAERGWIPISGNFIPTSFVKAHWDAYAAASEKAGHRPDRRIWRVARSILVTGEEAEARDYIADPEGGMTYYFRYLRTLAMMRTTPGTPDDAVRAQVEVQVNEALEDQIVVGSPQSVLDQLVAFRDRTGDFGTLLATGHDWDRPQMWKRSMTLLAEEVMPRFRQHCDATPAGD